MIEHKTVDHIIIPFYSNMIKHRIFYATLPHSRCQNFVIYYFHALLHQL